MSQSQSWTVTVKNRRHEIRADEDAASGKAFVRVDGRIAARPMLTDDEECDILVDGVPYRVMRHATDGFALDLGAASVTSRYDQQNAPRVDPEIKAAGKNSPLAIAGGVFALFAVLSIIYYSSYSHIRWRSFEGDGYTIDFPRTPQHQDTPVGSTTMKLDAAEFRRHGYAVGYFDLPSQLDPLRVPKLLNDILDRTVEKEHGTLTSQSLDRYMGRPAVSFACDVGKTDSHGPGKMQGRVIISRFQRIYILFTFVPQNEDYTADTDHFMSSMILTRDETMPAASQEAASAPQPRPNLVFDLNGKSDPNRPKTIDDLRREENERAQAQEKHDHDSRTGYAPPSTST